MSKETQITMQFASWITKNRWAALLKWFDQNDSENVSWNTLFDKAKMHDIQKKWPHYIAFFEKHLETKSCKNATLISHSEAQKRSWTLFNIAFPTFFAKAAPLLTPAQHTELRGKLMEWMNPWFSENETVDLSNAKNCFNTAFNILTRLDALDEWNSIKHLMPSAYISSILKHTIGKDLQWVQGLKELHVASGKDLDSWRVMLLKTDCVEHLSAEETALPVTHAFLDYAVQTPQALKLEDSVWAVIKRLPYFRVWVEQASGEDAQACRALLGIIEIDIEQSNVAKTICIGKNVGLELKDLTYLLDASTAKPDDIAVDPDVFEESVSNSPVI